MKRLILVITLLTASMAFGHESENDPKHNAIHNAYIGKIHHAHSHGNAGGAAQGDFHDHENSYKFSDANHNQALSNYYLSLHDVNNPDNFNERGELYFDHGLHTPDYVVIPPVQSNRKPARKPVDKPVDKPVESTVESTPVAVYTPRSTRVVIAPVVLPTNVLRISYLSFDDISVEVGLTAYAPDTQINQLIISIKGYDFQTPDGFFGASVLGTGEMRTVIFNRRFRSSRRWVDMICVSPENTVEVGGHAIIGTIRDRITVSIRDSGSDIIRDSITQADIDSDGNRVGTVASAPSQRKPKLTTMWATLKKGE